MNATIGIRLGSVYGAVYAIKRRKEHKILMHFTAKKEYDFMEIDLAIITLIEKKIFFLLCE
jgi:hypothetical protein